MVYLPLKFNSTLFCRATFKALNVELFMHTTVAFIIVLLVLCLPAIHLLAQTHNPDFEHLTVDHGLSQNLIYSILQDRQGFLWFGTKDGLNRYDGYRFTIFRHDPFDSTSISGQEIKVLYEDRAGNLWIGSTGLNRFDRMTETFARYLHDPANPNTLSHNEIYAIAEDSRLDGTLWIGTDHGLNKLQKEQRANGKGQEARGKSQGASASIQQSNDSVTFTHYLHDPKNPQSLSDNRVTAILMDHAGTLWVGTEKGLNKLQKANLAFVRYTKEAPMPYHLKDDFVTCLYEDRKGNLWVGAVSGLFQLDRDNGGVGKFRYYPHPTGAFAKAWQGIIKTVRERPDGKLWIGTLTGLALFDPMTGTYHNFRHDPADPQSLGSEGILAIYHDCGGIFWFGSAGKGLHKLNPHAKVFRHYGGKGDRRNGQNAFSVHALIEDQSGRLWLNANDRLYQLDRATGEWRQFESAMAPVGSLIEDRQGILWFATGNGLWEFDPRTKRLARYQHDPGDEGSLPSNAVWHVIEGKDGSLWVLAVGGMLSRLDGATGRWAHFKIPAAEKVSVHRMHQDAGGIFWLGSDAGLVRFDPVDSSARYYRNDPGNPASLGYDMVYSILPDPREPERFLWLGTAGGGLNRFEMATEKFTHYTEKDGLPNNVVYGILPDRHGRLWMSTNHGLSVFDPQTGAFRNFDVHDGLQSNEFNRAAYFLGKKGEMFFGGVNGLNAFYPDSIRSNPHAPPVVITDFQLAYQPVSFRDPHSPLRQPISETAGIRLAYDQNTIAFEFVALDFAEPQKNRYAYMLENFDPQWVQNGTNRKATYTNLAPGHYVFRVKGANNDGLWNEAGASLKITITPPWWKTWWFRMGSVLAILVLLISVHRWRTAYIEARKRALEKEVAERKQAEMKLQNSRKQLRALTGHLHELMERERISIAQDIHDELGSVFTALKIDLTLLERGLEKSSPPGADDPSLQEIRAMKKTIDATVGKMREFVRRLRPEVLDDLGLLAALEWQMQEFQQRIGVAYEFKSETAALAVEEHCAIAVFRIFQEALTNIARHAHASKVVVHIRQNQGQAAIAICDNGVGMPAEKLASPDTFGLLGMRERALMFGGEVEITSAPGKGTTVLIKVPLAR